MQKRVKWTNKNIKDVRQIGQNKKQELFNSFANEMLQQIQKVKIIDKENVKVNNKNKTIVKSSQIKGIKDIKQQFISKPYNKQTFTNIISSLENEIQQKMHAINAMARNERRKIEYEEEMEI